MKRLLQYWPEILAFSVIGLVTLNAVSPNLTFFNMAADGPAYVMSAKYLYPAHHTSAPLYLLLGHLFTLIPIGTDYFRLALLSWVFAVGSVILVYLIARNMLSENKWARWYALVASALFGSSMMLISQAIITEVYTMVTFLSLAAFYFTLKKQWALVAIMLGLGLATHHLILITWAVLLIFNKPLRNWKPIVITLAFGLFYLYIPLSKALTDAPQMWLNTGLFAFLRDNISTFIGLVGGLAIWDFPKRLLETLGFLGVSFTIGFVILIWYTVKAKLWSKQLFWLFLLSTIYAATNLDPHVSRYALIGYPFAAIIIAIALSKVKPVWLYSTGVAAIAMLGINGNYLDIGRNLDPHLTATQFYNEELPKVKDGQIMMSFLPGGQWQETFLYNKNEGRKIIPICIGMLSNPDYQDLLWSQGVKLARNNAPDQTNNEMQVALSIVYNNKDVWIAVPTTMNDYGSKLVPAEANTQELTKWMGHETIAEWKFVPSNPYYIVTGAVESDWQWVLHSNKDIKFFAGFAAIGLILNWFMFVLPNRKAKEKETLA